MEVNAALVAAEAEALRCQQEVARLRQELQERDSQFAELAGQFNILRRKYAYLKETHNEVLWDFLPRNVHEFRYLQVHTQEGCTVVKSESNTNVDAIELHHALGSGRFGEVRLGVIAHPDGSEEELALKAVAKAQIRSLVSFRNLANEIACMRHLTAVKLKAAGAPESPETVGLAHIVTLHSASMSNSAVYLAQTVGGCDLFTLMSLYCPGGMDDLGRLPTCMVEAIARGLWAAISAVHRNGWCHRDIKPENVLIGADAQKLASMHSAKDAAARIHVRVCDFGVCAPLPRANAAPLTQFCGSPGFFAPELADAMRGSGRAAVPLIPEHAGEDSDEENVSGDALRPCRGAYEGPAADVFSAGATLLEMLLGRARFAKLWSPAYHDCGRRSLTRSLRYATEAATAALRVDAGAEDARRGAVVAMDADAASGGPASASDSGPALRRLTTLALACVDTNARHRPTSDATVAELARQSPPASPAKPPPGEPRSSRQFHRRYEFAGTLDLEAADSGSWTALAPLLKQSATAPLPSRPLIQPPSPDAPRRTSSGNRLVALAGAASPPAASDHLDGGSGDASGAADQRPVAADRQPAAAPPLTTGGGDSGSSTRRSSSSIRSGSGVADNTDDADGTARGVFKPEPTLVVPDSKPAPASDFDPAPGSAKFAIVGRILTM